MASTQDTISVHHAPAPTDLRVRRLLLAAAAVAIVSSACDRRREPAPRGTVPAVTWRALEPSSLPADQQARITLATDARNDMFGRLMSALGQAMATEGTAGAIDVCRERAPQIAQEVGAAHGVRIGRTSERLRNPDNRAPAWAQAFLSERPEAPVYALADDGTLGAVLPIRIMTLCLACHGAPASIAPAVRDALAMHYPDDAATGYAEGDLRGWFWVEVPAGG